MDATSEPTSEQPLILVCNDDGIDAPGIEILAAAMTALGDVYVAAPATEQSAVGHAITVRDPVRARPYEFDEWAGHVEAYAVTGTPADCVKLAVNQFLPHVPDLVVSGINRGPNTAVNVIYSGTVSAATEAAILGIDAAAFSLCAWEDGHYDTAARFARRIAARVLREGLPEGVLLNVNVPDLPVAEVQGVAVTRQARSRWKESFEARTDPFDRPYYWLTGTFVNLDEGDDTDVGAIEAGRVSITPIHYDLTAYAHLDSLRTWSWQEEGVSEREDE